MALQDLQNIFLQHGKTCEQFGLPPPAGYQYTEVTYNQDEEFREGQEAYNTLNDEQRRIADEVLNAITDNLQHTFFVDCPGGSGKTYLYQTLCHLLRGQGKTVYPVAWTGIAAKLLQGGSTSHSLFKLPVSVLDTSVSSIRANSIQAK